MKISIVRWVVLAACFVAISVGLIMNTSLGTLSSFGWQAIATICPLGAIESFLAGKAVFLRALIVLAAAVVLVIVFGKAFCAWICPVAPVRSLLTIIKARFGKAEKAARSALADNPEVSTGASSQVQDGADTATDKPAGAIAQPAPSCSGSCSSCASKRAKLDSRHLVLGGSLLSAALFGFPVFCLVCPIGLIFGTIIVAWQFFGADDVSLSLLIYPAILILELLVLRKWCAKFCPLGAMMSLLSIPNRLFKPKVEGSKCLREQGRDCHICSTVCPEGLDPHYKDGMHECSKCGLCRDKCPAGAITIPLLATKGTQDTIDTKTKKTC